MPLATFPMWGKTTTPKTADFGTFPTWQKQVAPTEPITPPITEGIPLFGVSPFGILTGAETFAEFKEAEQRVVSSIPLTDEAEKPITLDLFPTDVGLGNEVLKMLFKVVYEEEEIIEWEPRVEGMKPAQLSFSVDSTTGDILALFEGRMVGSVNAQTGQFALDESFINEVRNSYIKAYGKKLPVYAWGTGVPIQITNKLQEFLYTKRVVGETILPSIAEVLGVVGLVGTVAIMGYQGIRAINQLLATSPKVGKLYSHLPGVTVKGQPPPPKTIHDTLTGKLRSLTVSEIKLWKQFQQTVGYQNFQTTVNAANIQRTSGLYRASEELLFRGFQLTQQGRGDIAQNYFAALQGIYKGWFAGGQMGQQAEQFAGKTINIVINAPTATSNAIAQVVQTVGAQGLSPAAITPSFIAGFVPTGQVLAITPLIISELTTLGFTAEAINAMKPEEAWARVVSNLVPTALPVTPVPTEIVATTGEPFTATVYRGTQVGVAPIDEGLVGKAEYHTTDPAYAATYGTVTTSTVELDNPLVIKTQSEWDAFAIRTRELRDTAVAEGRSEDWVQATLRSQLEKEGYDGVVITEGIVEAGAQVAVFHPEEAVKEFVPTAAMAEWETVTGEIPTSELRQSIWATVKVKGISDTQARSIYQRVSGKKSLGGIKDANILNRILAAVQRARPVKIRGANVIKLSTEKNIQTLKDILIAEKKLTPAVYENLKRDLGLITDRFVDKERFITESEGRKLIREMNFEAEVGLTAWDAKVAEVLVNKPELGIAIDGLSSKIVAANPETKVKKTFSWTKFAGEISELPNDVGLSGGLSVLRALRRMQEQLGGRAATRIYDIAEMTVEQRQLNDVILAQIINEIKASVPEVMRITQNPQSDAKIQQWLDADLALTKVTKPDLTPDELKVAQMFRAGYDQWKNDVRLERFKDAYYHYQGNAELMKEGDDAVAIIDAPLADLKEGIRIYESRGETGLANYLKTKTWGVIESGYSYSQVIHPKLKLAQRWAIRAQSTSLHQRKDLAFRVDERTTWERYIAYVRQMIGLNLQPYYRKMDRELSRIKKLGRLKDPGADANKISLFLQEVKGFHVESPVARYLLRMGGWSFSTLSLNPWMSVRNLHQNLAHHEDKLKVLKALFTKGFFKDPITRSDRMAYTEAFVYQHRAAAREQLLMGYMGKTPVENLLRKIVYYPKSDHLNRYASMGGSGDKAEGALKQYLKDGNVQKFLEGSGANGLSQTEQIRILEYLALDSYDYMGVLNPASGGEAAIRDIGKRITTLNHFNYIRYLRSIVEMGESGRILGSLVSFPRSTVEKYLDIFSRIKGRTGADRKRAIHALLAMVIGSVIASALLSQITGKKRDAYNPLLVMQWQVGGLALGAVGEIQDTYRHLTNLAFAEDEAGREYALKELEILVPRLGDMFIPFYSLTMNFIESLADSKYIDRKTLRRIREIFSESYELNEEFYEIERTQLERIQHGLFGTNTPNPTDLESALKKLQGTEEMLGQVDTDTFEKARQKAEEEGRLEEWSARYTEEDYLYTTSNLGSDINGAIYGLDPSEITTENGFSDLVLAYMEYQVLFEEYKWSPPDKRYEYREENPETDANLFFWSYVVTLQSDRAEQIVTSMIREFNIPTNAVRGYQKIAGGEFPGWGETGGATWETPETEGFPKWGK